jgi:hypothetical protein
VRDGARWTQRECRPGEAVVLKDPLAELAVDDVYAGIDLDSGD